VISNIRLSESEQDGIVASVLDLKGCQPVAIHLFGSRTDMGKRGGDIDLWVELSAHPSDPSLLARALRMKLEDRLGAQKFDLVFSGPLTEVMDPQLAAFRDTLLSTQVTLWKALTSSS
jgi:hypothetical protein